MKMDNQLHAKAYEAFIDAIYNGSGEPAAMRAAIAIVREAVIEECAQTAENHYLHEPMFVIERESAFSIARAIRALKEKKP